MLSKFSVKKPYTVLVGVVLAIVLGVVSFTRMTTDLLPSISLPYVIVMTTYVGASPETVETVVTKPIEASMETVSNIQNVSSVSSENYSLVILEFGQTTDMNAVSLEIRENLDQIKSYWDDSVGSPIIMKLNPDMMPVMVAAVGVSDMTHGEISAYVENEIAPDLESIEGVASVSITGLLEESVNVVINQEKIDAINEKIFAAIDEKMLEAEQELLDGQQEIEDGLAEIEDQTKEVNKGIQELNNSKAELENGKTELEQKKNETTDELAAAKTDLLTAKSNLESTQLTLNTNLTTARSLQSNISAISSALSTASTYQTKATALGTSLAAGELETAEALKQELATLKTNYLSNSIVKSMAAESTDLAAIVNNLNTLDWSDVNNVPTVYGSLYGITAASESTLNGQKANMESALNSTTNSMGLAAYESFAASTLNTINTNLAQVNEGLKEIEKGELSAAIEFANANTEIALGEYQMEVAKTQLESAKDQLESGKKELEDAQQQIEDGKEQLVDAKQDAYDKADMQEIITVEVIEGLLTAQNFSMPAGYLTEDGTSYLVRVGDKPTSVEEMQTLPLMDLHMDGVPMITLADVADVFYTDNSADIYTNINGSSGCMLNIQKQTGYSTGEVSDLLNEEFKALMDADDSLTIINLMDQGIYIDMVMDSILNNLLFGAILAIFILLMFLKDMRPTLIIACAIPISLVVAIVCMYFSGVTLNIISLSGLSLGIGMLVDNSIVVIENIYRLRGEGASMRKAAIEGAKEVAGAIMASTLTTICVFAPIVFTDGITRQLFVDMGLTIAYSLIASLVVALTVVPAMASKVLTKTKEQKDGKFFQAIIYFYEKVLAWSLRFKPLILLMVILILGGSIALAMSNGTAFMPEMDSTQLTVTVELPSTATLEQTKETTNEVVSLIQEIEDVTDVGAMTATSSMSMLTGAGNTSENSTTIYVVAKEDKTLSNEEIAAIIMEKTVDINAEISIETSSMDMSALGGSGITVQIRGRDIDTLQQLAGEVAEIVKSVEGTANVSDGLEESSEELRITIDKDKAISYGLTTAQVYMQIAGKLAEASASTTLEEADKDYSVYTMDGSDILLTRELVKSMEVTGTDADGVECDIPLSEIAEFATEQALDSINRTAQTRYISVTAEIADGYNVGIVSSALEDTMANYEVPEGYSIAFSGENETINDALSQVGLMLVLALVFMYLIMVAQFQSLLSPFIIMFTIPLAFTGGFIGLYMTGSEISVIAMIGFVMLSGIIVNNGIVLIDYMNQLREQGMEKKEAILTAGKTRLRPVLMTAMTTILALSTMVFSKDMGSEMAKPMAIVTIGGLLYGTLLTLLVIPCIYDMFTRKEYNTELSMEVDDGE